ncbi:unnamed protein product [Urochloa humidicola]
MRRREEMADAARARSTCRPGPNLPRTHLGSRGGGGSLRDDEAGSSEYICASRRKERCTCIHAVNPNTGKRAGKNKGQRR